MRGYQALPRLRAQENDRELPENRIHATLAKYGMQVEGVADAFGRRGKEALRECISKLPPHTRFVTERLLKEAERLDEVLEQIEARMGEFFQAEGAIKRLMTLPGVGFILAVVIRTEVGDVRRFGRPEQLAAPAAGAPGCVVRGSCRYGPMRAEANRYLKCAFVEAANALCRLRAKYPQRHTSRLSSGWPAARGTKRPSGRWPGTWRMRSGLC